MAIEIRMSEISYDVVNDKVVIKYLPYDTDAQKFIRPFGFSKKVELDKSELTQQTLDELVLLGQDNL